ncbi:hypothetical protein [Streptomyces sp. C10-9-1]|uniref:hypothetical protein n=1 Tax=Streptomyces sp. C10-9-1 TaxID=1859285 RepID=UPI003D726075
MRICVPLRLVVGAQYRDAALRVYIKIAALAQRPQGCRAKVETLAGWLDTSKSTIERGLRDLQNPDPVDGITEVLTTHKTSRDGTGESAHRTVREVDTDHGELYVWIPVRAADTLPCRLLRLYAAIAYAQARRMPLTVRELADHLRHESGDHEGETLTERQTSRLLDDLEATGWITIHRRQGPRGRHIYEAHTSPLHAVPAPQATTAVVVPAPRPSGPEERPAPAEVVDVCPDIHDGPAPEDRDGPPCEEDRPTDRPGLTPPAAVSGSAVRRLSPVARGPVDNPAPAGCGPQGGRGTHGASRRRSGDGSAPTLSARAWTVLEPVRHLLDGETRGWEVARIEREIARQLATGTGMRRITDRLQRRYACTDRVRHGARWILGAGLPRATGLSNCQLDACEDGTIWHTGHPCGVCADLAPPAQPPAETAPAPASAPAPPAPASAPEQHRGWVPAPRPALDGDVPPVLTRAQALALREQATTAEVRAAIGRWGRALAIELYGWRLVGPLLPTLDDSRDGGPDAC